MQRALASFLLTTIYLLTALALSSCSLTAHVGLHDAGVFSLSGRLQNYDPSSFSTSPTTLSCSGPLASLYQLDGSGNRVEPALASTVLASDGTYSFDMHSLGLQFSNQTPLVSYVVVVSGCTNGIYTRPVTGATNQDITAGSSLLGYVSDTAYKSNMSQVLQTASSDLQSLIAQLQTYGTFGDAFQALTTNTALASQFQNLFGFSASALTVASPEISFSNMPTQGSELVSLVASVQAVQWSSDYAIAYDWKLDGVIISNSASLLYVPTANQQGSHVLSVTVGLDDGTGHVDITKETKTISNALLVANNILPAAPALSVTNPVVSGSVPINSRNITVTVATGANKNLCASFSNMLLTEDPAPPSAMTVFPLSCTQSGYQDQSFTITTAGDGLKTLYLWAIDASGTVSLTPSTFSFYLDTAAPTLTIATIPPALTNATSQSFAFSAFDNGGMIDHYECLLDSGSWSGCSSPKSYSGLTEGDHTFQARAVDTAGNISAAASESWHVDLTAPTLLLTSKPSVITNQLSGTFIFSATDSGGGSVAGTLCAVDGGSYASCSSPYITTLLAGSHNFYVRAQDTAGNLSSAVSYSWTIDTTAPSATIISTPASLTNSQTASFGFSGNDTGGGTVASFTCSIDSGTSTTCTSPATYSSLVAGAHTFAVRAVDSAGNIGAAASFSWTIDLTTPMAVITSHPNNLTNSTAANFSFSATAPPSGSITGYECNIDGGTFAACSSPASYASLAQGSHTFSVYSIDNNGNDSAVTTFTWTVDLTKPVLTIGSQPTNPTANALASFVFSATDTGGGTVAGFECNLDGAGFASCASPQTYSGLADGSHSVVIHALDTAGNVSLNQTTTWVIDTTAPTVLITSQPAAITNSTSAHFVFSATDATSISGYTCVVDGGSPSACTSPVDLTGLSSMIHNFAVQATDAVGNTSAAVRASWTIDTTAPIVTISAGPAALGHSTSATFTFSATDSGGGAVASYSCQLDGAAFSACSSPQTYSSLSSSNHIFGVRALDTAGNVSTVASAGWTIDTTPPALTITTPSTSGMVAQSSSLANYTLSGACSENGINVTISGAVTGSASCASGAWSTAIDLSALADGSASLTATQTDAAGNSTAVSTSVIVDKTQPAVSVVMPANPAYLGGSSLTLAWAASDTNLAATPISLSYSINGGSSWSAIATSIANSGTYIWTVPAVNSAAVKIKMTAVDKAGNTNSAISASTFTIDSTAPTISAMTINGGSTSPVASNNVPISLTASDNFVITQFCFKYNTTVAPLVSDACWIPVTSAGATPGPTLNINNYYFRIGFGGGTYTIYAWVRDQAGNISSLTSTAGVDTGSVTYVPAAPPAMTAVVAVSNNSSAPTPTSSDLTVLSGNDVYIYWQASDAATLPSNAISLTYTTNDSTWTAVTGATGLPNVQGSGCTLFASYTGCYKWANGAPTSSYFRVQARVVDTAGYSSVNISRALNASVFNFLAGNTNVGTGASATAGVFLAPVEGDNRFSAPGSLVVAPNGTIYMHDVSRGILKVDPVTGVTTVFLAAATTSTGDGGAVTLATAKAPNYIVLDHNNNLLVYDYNLIRLIDLSANPPTISTLIGGGSSTSDTLSSPTQLSLTGNASASNNNSMSIMPLQNGDILFRIGSPANKIRWYHASDSSLTAVNLNGTGGFPAPGNTIDVGICTMIGLAPVTDSSGNLIAIMSEYQANPVSTGVACSYNTSYPTYEAFFSITTGTLQTIVGGGPGVEVLIPGRNNQIYRYVRQSGQLQVLNTTNLTYTTIVNSPGVCPDGTALSACANSFDDVFIDLSGKMYFADNGAIRTVSDQNTLLTIAGQNLNYGNGLAPIQARFGTVAAINLWNDGTQDQLTILDTREHYFRETGLASGSTISNIAGNGASASAVSSSTLANVSSIYDAGGGQSMLNFALDSVGNIFAPMSNVTIGEMSRSSGKWTTRYGGGSTGYTTAPDGTLGTSIKLLGTQYMPVIAGGVNGQVLVASWDSSRAVIDTPQFELLSESNFTQTTLTATTALATNGGWSATGTALNSCIVPSGLQKPLVAYDSVANAYSVSTSGNANLYKIVPGGNLSIYFNAGRTIQNFAYRRESATVEDFYYCSSDFRIYKAVLTSGSLTSNAALTWPISSMSCTGNSMIYSASRNSLIFIYQQSGLNGVAEYLSP